jgi:hypothetical protein
VKSLHIFTIAYADKSTCPPADFIIRTHHVVPWTVDGLDWMNDPESLRAMVSIVAAANKQAAALRVNGLPGVELIMPIAKAASLCHELKTGPYGRQDGGPYAMLVSDEFYTWQGLQKYLAPKLRDRQLWIDARILADNLSGLKRHLPS